MMKNFNLNEFALIPNFPFSINKGTHTGDFPIHTHSYSELMIVLGGSAIHEIDTFEYELKAGDVFLISGCTCHGFKSSTNLRHFNVMFDLKYLTEKFVWLKRLSGFQTLFFIEPYYRVEQGLESRLHLNHNQLEFIEELLSSMLLEYENRQDGFQQIISAYFISLASYLSRQFSKFENNSNKKLLQFADTVAFLEQNYTQPLTLEMLSNKTHLSARHFSRIFKQIYNLTPTEFIIKLRLEQSCRLLANTDVSLTEIAMDCGFYDQAAFSKQFKQRLGISPFKYRKQYRYFT